MRKLIAYALALALLVSICGCGKKASKPVDKNPDKSVSDSKDESNNSKDDYEEEDGKDDENDEEYDEDEEYEDDYGDYEDDGYYDDGSFDSSDDTAGTGSMSVNVGETVHARKDLTEIRPSANRADMIYPQVFEAAGANSEALAKREEILNTKDNITVTGTKYYVSNSGSDENNDGKSPEKAFATIGHANSKAKEGDGVFIERKGIYRLASGVSLKNGVKYAAYGEGEKPEIWGSPVNYAQSGFWAPHSIENVWKMNFTRSDVGIIVFNHGELAGELKDYIRGLNRTGDYFFDERNKVLYLYCDKGNPGKVYKDIEIGNRMIMFRIPNGGHDIVIDNLSFKYTGTFAIRGSEAVKNITVKNCEIGWLGGSYIPRSTSLNGGNRYGNGIEFTSGAENLTVENNWVYQVFDAGITFQGTGSPTAKEPWNDPKYRTYKDVSFSNNLVEYCSWALEWWPSTVGSLNENIKFNDNIIRLSGYGWARDLRYPCHIRGVWGGVEMDIVNFEVKNNIFDCANGSIYDWPLIPGDKHVTENKYHEGHIIDHNTYYQFARHTSPLHQVPVFGIGSGENVTSFATNQAEFDEAVKVFDKNPVKIQWIDKDVPFENVYKYE